MTEFGGPDALRLMDLPDPMGPALVRLGISVAAVNPTDTNYRSGAQGSFYPDERAPWIPGMDADGLVAEVGEGVDHVAVGDVAMAVVIPHRAYRENKVLPGDCFVKTPTGRSAVGAATLPMNGLTARRTLDLLSLRPGRSARRDRCCRFVGGYLVQMAKAEGLTVIADAADADEELRAFGADVVVRRGDDVARRIREEFPHDVDALADGSLQHTLVFPAVKDVARSPRFAATRAARGSVLPDLVSQMAAERPALEQLRQYAEGGDLALRVAATFGAEHARAARCRRTPAPQSGRRPWQARHHVLSEGVRVSYESCCI